MKIGILGAGGIAATLAETMNKMPKVECYGVASRDLAKAEKFIAEHGFQKAFGSYEDMMKDTEVELVYIATPHSHHYRNMKMCLEAGKHVLCEKAFTVNAKQAEEILRLAKEKGLLVTEAIWTRYMPSRKMIKDLLDDKIIGDVRKLTPNLNYNIYEIERIIRPELAGGALLDVGVYPLNFAFMSFGDCISEVKSAVQLTDTGVDGENVITLFYEDGRVAVLTSGIYGLSDRQGIFYGTKGYMVVDNVNNPNGIKVYNEDRELIKDLTVPEKISGYEYEILETIDCIKNKKLECPSMPHEDTLKMMRFMDGLRKEWGVKYPDDIESL